MKSGGILSLARDSIWSDFGVVLALDLEDDLTKEASTSVSTVAGARLPYSSESFVSFHHSVGSTVGVDRP